MRQRGPAQRPALRRSRPIAGRRSPPRTAATGTRRMQARGILITGAGSGIGAGIAAELAAAGHHIVVTDLDGEAAGRVAKQLADAGGSAEAHALDVSSDASVAAVLGAMSRPAEVLVNNAGLQHVAPLEDFPLARWNLLVQVMLV